MTPDRKVYGRVYELFTTRPDLDSAHPYVGKTTGTIHQRVHGRGASAHTSRQSIARDPWKARIRPGREGYRLLETVYATGDEQADAASLRRAEAFWIDRLRPKRNDVRPVRPPAHESPKALRPPSRRALAQERAARRARRRVLGFAFLFLLATVLTAALVSRMHLPWPAAPWVASPVAGLFVALEAMRRIDAAARRVVRGRR